MSELKACPFCSESESLLVEHLDGTVQRPAYRIKCDTCGASTSYCDRGNHIDYWNTRQSDPRIKAMFDCVDFNTDIGQYLMISKEELLTELKVIADRSE